MTTAPTTDPLPRRRGRRRTVALVAGTAALTVAGTALATGALGPGAAPAAADGLTRFDDCTQVRDWYVEALDPGVGPWGLDGFAVPDVARDTAAGAAEDSAAGAAPGDAVGTGATGTNLQEAGVDEPDTVKVDPARPGLVVTTAGDRLVVVDVGAGAPRQVGSLVVPGLGGSGYGGWGVTSDTVQPAPEAPSTPGSAELLLDGDRVVLLSQGWASLPGAPGQPDGQGVTTDRVAPGTVPGTSTTTTTVVDLADPTAPRLVSQQEVGGWLVGARLTDGVVRVVTSSTPVVPTPAGTVDTTVPGWEGEATARHREALAQMRGEQFLPAAITRDADGVVTGRAPALSCSDLAHTSVPSGGGVLTVRSLDPGADGDPVVDVAGVAADGDLVYASTDRLYVATTRGGWASWGRGAAETGDPDEVRTELHGFDTSEGAATTYLASGEVDGFLLGRWALSARDGRLRVATTTGAFLADPQSGQEQSQSWVTVLEERAGELVQVGQVGGLGVGETIRSVRWFDDVATVVTFRQTDPLYVVDLSDPTAPAVTGELKVPGYSAYLHPLGEDRLLGVGQDATAEGRTTGVLVQTFDLADRTAPAQVSTWTEADTWTSVEGDSRQLTYLPDRRTALLPLDTMEGPGLQAISVGDDGALADAGRYRLGTQQGYGYLVRAVAVGDRVVLLTGTDGGAELVVLGLDGLTRVGSTDLGR